MNMAPRTLARRLAAENISYQKAMDDLRRDLAEAYLREGNISISYVAWLLGFQEVSSFGKAFKRWTGMRPSQVRGGQQSITQDVSA